MKAYPLSLRQEILRACAQRRASQQTIAAFYGVSRSFVEKLLRQHRTTGGITPRPHAGGRRAICDEATRHLVRRLIHKHPSATLAELCAHVLTQRGLRISVPTMARLVTSLGGPQDRQHSTPTSRAGLASNTRQQPRGKKSPRSTIADPSAHRPLPCPPPSSQQGRTSPLRRLDDLPIRVWMPAADSCIECEAPYKVRLVAVETRWNFGEVEIRAAHREGCLNIGEDARQGVGWETSGETLTWGEWTLPILRWSATVGVCVACARLLVSVPVMVPQAGCVRVPHCPGCYATMAP